MFRFLNKDGTPQAASGAQRWIQLVKFALPTEAGGTRLWCLGDRPATFNGETYAVYDHVLPITTPPANVARLESLEEWEMRLQDSDGAWRDLLCTGPLGPRVGRLGSRAWVFVIRELDGVRSANAQFAATGWLRQAEAIDEGDGRMVRLSFANEAWSLDRDATVSMTWDAERDVDENATSAKFSAEAQDVAWGFRQGVRARR